MSLPKILLLAEGVECVDVMKKRKKAKEEKKICWTRNEGVLYVPFCLCSLPANHIQKQRRSNQRPATRDHFQPVNRLMLTDRRYLFFFSSLLWSVRFGGKKHHWKKRKKHHWKKEKGTGISTFDGYIDTRAIETTAAKVITYSASSRS